VQPTFCRHNRFIQNCPVCRDPEPPKPARASRSAPPRGRGASAASRSAVRVRRLEQAVSDGYRSELAPGLKATADAQRLADELAFATARLEELQSDPPGVYAEIAAEPDLEEALWLAFLTAYLTPTGGDDPFANIRSAHVPWSSGELPRLDVELGPRTSHDPASEERTVAAYRAWARRAGSQAAAFAGEAAWPPQRRFDRVFERLALPGFGRAGRYELLVTLGRLGLVDVGPASLQLTDDATTLAAKRVFGIGDKMLLERRALDLAQAADLPIEALDLGLFNWAAVATAPARLGARTGVPDSHRFGVAEALGI